MKRVCFSKSNGVGVFFMARRTNAQCKSYTSGKVRAQRLALVERLRENPHPNVAKVYGVHKGRIVTRDSGQALHMMPNAARVLDERRFKRDMQAALDHLHGLGLAHNDLHARNVTWDGERFVLIDFDTLTEGEEGDDVDLLWRRVQRATGGTRLHTRKTN